MCGLVLRDELFGAAQSFQAANLGLETHTRWWLVETAWSTGIARGLLAPVPVHDAPTASLVVVTNRRRRSMAGVVGALSGYQDGCCAYCQEPMLLRGRGQEVVEHVLPWRLLGDRWAGPDLDAVWNLVLACQPWNSAKHARAPSERWMEWLERRNNDLIASHHPLRQTLMAQTGQTIPNGTPPCGTRPGGAPTPLPLGCFRLSERPQRSSFASGRPRARSFRWSFRHTLRRVTGPHQLDVSPDLSSTDTTKQHGMDGRGSTSNP